MPENCTKNVIYKKPSKMGTGKIPVNAIGKVLKYVEHPITTKLLVDFGQYGKAIVPLSAVEICENECS